MISSISKDGIEIRDLDDWRDRAGPKKELQWKDGRSAKESARSWLANRSFPAELLRLLDEHEDFASLNEWHAEPEALVRIDDFRGEPPNIDVLVRARDKIGALAIVIEAKADEPFGSLVADTLKDAERRLTVSPNSKGKDRLERLTFALLNGRPEDPGISQLRYQLLTACGAAIAEAERIGAVRAVVLVHEFVSDATVASKRHANQKDLDKFLSILSPSNAHSTGLVGPIEVPGEPITRSQIALYIGKVSSDIRGGGA